MPAKNPAKNIVVTGDVTIDWNLALRRAPGEAGPPAWWPENDPHLSYQRGGAALLADLISAVVEAKDLTGKYVIHQRKFPANITPDAAGVNHSHASWLQYPRSRDDKEKEIWRVHEFLGIKRAKDPRSLTMQSDPKSASIVVIDDAGLGFRNHKGLFPTALTSNDTQWILLKMACPIAEGALWNALDKKKVIALLTANDIRVGDTQLSRSLSWDRALEDAARLIVDQAIPGLRECANVIISFQAAGAIIYSKGRRNPFQLVFSKHAFEGSWESGHRGRMMGQSACLVGEIVRELIARRTPDLTRAVDHGLGSLRRLCTIGWEEEDGGRLSFPLKETAGVTPRSFTVTAVKPPSTGSANRNWSILGAKHSEHLYDRAKAVVLEGASKVLADVPVGRFGQLCTVDRHEIESLRSILFLIHEYAAEARPPRPLSIATFGPPGSGKSFGVKQLAKSLRAVEAEILEFNLSQFQSPAELHQAFHRVRNAALGPKLPFIFWDEFDSPLDGDQLGWLRHFLAPMQDGVFQQGESVHALGRAVFIFAGGTTSSLDQFLASSDYARKELKAPDFVSRLKGALNVMGINRQMGDDPHHILRRAVLLRSLLERDRPHLFVKRTPQMDAGVLCALLRTKEYRHGSRSMESILAMSQIAHHGKFERSSLPAREQLELHVDAREFLALVDSPEFSDTELDQMARKVHELFLETVPADHSSRKDFAELPANEKEQNRGQVLDIPIKLAGVGLLIVRSGDPRDAASIRKEDEEVLARQEHDRWVKLKIDSGWAYSKTLDKRAKLHDALLPWDRNSFLPPPYRDAMGTEDLPESQRWKDRYAVRNIAKVLEAGGYKMIALSA